jgi:hypothetical protein
MAIVRTIISSRCWRVVMTRAATAEAKMSADEISAARTSAEHNSFDTASLASGDVGHRVRELSRGADRAKRWARLKPLFDLSLLKMNSGQLGADEQELAASPISRGSKRRSLPRSMRRSNLHRRAVPLAFRIRAQYAYCSFRQHRAASRSEGKDSDQGSGSRAASEG